MGRVAIFIDGGYLQKTIQNEFGFLRIDFGRLAQRLASGKEILRTYFYTCEPYQSNPPTTEESERFGRAQKFHYALEQLPRFQVRYGKLAFRGKDANGRPILQQKQVDIQLGVDLVCLALKNHITDAVVLAGDSDFLPAIDAAKLEGVVLHLYHGKDPHTDLVARCDERTRIDRELLDSVKLG